MVAANTATKVLYHTTWKLKVLWTLSDRPPTYNNPTCILFGGFFACTVLSCCFPLLFGRLYIHSGLHSCAEWYQRSYHGTIAYTETACMQIQGQGMAYDLRRGGCQDPTEGKTSKIEKQKKKTKSHQNFVPWWEYCHLITWGRTVIVNKEDYYWEFRHLHKIEWRSNQNSEEQACQCSWSPEG